jgi:hypothetical protein
MASWAADFDYLSLGLLFIYIFEMGMPSVLALFLGGLATGCSGLGPGLRSRTFAFMWNVFPLFFLGVIFRCWLSRGDCLTECSFIVVLR